MVQRSHNLNEKKSLKRKTCNHAELSKALTIKQLISTTEESLKLKVKF